MRKVALATLENENQITEAALCQWLEDTALLQGDQPLPLSLNSNPESTGDSEPPRSYGSLLYYKALPTLKSLPLGLCHSQGKQRWPMTINQPRAGDYQSLREVQLSYPWSLASDV